MPKDLAHEAVTRWFSERHITAITGKGLASLEQHIRNALALQRVFSYICFHHGHEVGPDTETCPVCEAPMRRR